MSSWVSEYLDELSSDSALAKFTEGAWLPSTPTNDGSAGEVSGGDYYKAAVDDGSYWAGEYSGPGSTMWDGSGATTQDVGAMARAYEDRGLDFKGLDASRYDSPKNETNVLDRIKEGAKRAWDKDPLEVLKFGANAIGGTLAADRQNRLMQAQIDAYNARIQQEKDNQTRVDNSIAAYKRKGAGYSGPLKTIGGQRVFNDNGTAKR